MKLATIVSYLVAKLPRGVLRGLMPLQGAMHRLFPFMKSKQMTEFTIPSGILKGKKFLLTYDEAKRYWHGGFEPGLLETFKEYVSSGMTVYDVGANLGFHSLALGVLVGERGKVFGFEPNPSILARLKNNISLNGAAKNVEAVGYAVLDREGEIGFSVSEVHHAQSQVAELVPLANGVGFARTIRILAITLDAFVFERSQPAPDIVKIDIEGAEHLAIEGMRRILRECRPLLFVELHNFVAAKAALETLLEFEYSTKHLSLGDLAVEMLDGITWASQTNYLFAEPK